MKNCAIGPIRFQRRLPTVALVAGCLLAAGILPGKALAADPVHCGGTAMLGAATLMCSHVAPKAPPQLCDFEWSLLSSSGGPQTVGGSFMLPPGATNVQVYQAGGFTRALAPPIVLCRKAGK
jgi:hypothetical protein